MMDNLSFLQIFVLILLIVYSGWGLIQFLKWLPNQKPCEEGGDIHQWEKNYATNYTNKCINCGLEIERHIPHY